MPRDPALVTATLVDKGAERVRKSHHRALEDLQRRVSALEALDFFVASYSELALGTTQSSNLTTSDHVEFDLHEGPLKEEGIVRLSSGSGQEQGIVTLAPRRTYLILTWIFVGVNEGHMRYRWQDTSGNDLNGDVGFRPAEHNSADQGTGTQDLGELPANGFIFTPTEEKAIVLQFTSVANSTGIERGSRALILRLK